MFAFNKAGTIAVAAGVALFATALSASADDLTNGPNGMQPNTLRSRTTSGKTPSRMTMKKPVKHRPRTGMMERPLVVRRGPAVASVPAPVATGPFELLTAPFAAASAIVALPFRVAGTVFPPDGDIATNPLVIIGAPIRAAGEIAQIPFRIITAPFGGPPLAAL